MSLFPKIERVCPYLDRLDEAMDGDFCRMCKRTVHDLTDMDRPQREAFLAACGGDACVSYIAYVRPSVAAALIAASAAVLVPEAAMAQRHIPKPPRVRPVEIPVMLGGAPPPIMKVPVVLAGEPVPVEPTKPPQPAVAPDRGTQTKRD